MRTLFLVVLYGLRPRDSATLRSLLAQPVASLPADSGLLVWNNGPQAMDETERQTLLATPGWAQVLIEEDLGNPPLSRVYNRALQLGSERLVVFDQDTVVDERYLQALGREAELLVPLVLGAGAIRYPHQYKQVVTSEGPLDPQATVTISSGLCLSRGLAQRIAARHGDVFDERFALYGVDVSFFLRVQGLAREESVELLCAGVLDHSLSELEEETPAQRRFRDIEKFYVALLLRLHYKGASRGKVLRYLGRQLLGNRPYLYGVLPQMLRTVFRGRHPRA
ncbi:glycosyltransferase family 2 protein [Pseudomonas oryzihabitans]|uniref:glycosyltransferase family 2 protein n=1 Tax=Pseudomonas oryzihabitans TaxID=47885 RepID=UPI00111CB07B|nr:glycosyl transferase [Pseudomonas psychrotolerans]QDD91389.1 glycosyl transferase [Pseudomonas psychrotolerans]